MILRIVWGIIGLVSVCIGWNLVGVQYINTSEFWGVIVVAAGGHMFSSAITGKW